MNKKVLISAMLLGMAASAATTTATAALATGAVLNFDTGVNSAYGKLTSGSYFGMDGNGDGVIKSLEKVGIAQNDGLIIGSVQGASGSHLGAPGCVNDEATADPATCTNAGENPGIDQAWSFFGNTGMTQSTSATNILSDDGAGNVTIDFSGFSVTWNGIADIPMSSGAWDGNAEGVANMTCAVDCAEGDTYTLYYSATVPAGDPSNFGGVRYNYFLTGTVGAATSAIPVPAAVWLFGSGLLGLAGVARRRKSA